MEDEGMLYHNGEKLTKEKFQNPEASTGRLRSGHGTVR